MIQLRPRKTCVRESSYREVKTQGFRDETNLCGCRGALSLKGFFSTQIPPRGKKTLQSLKDQHLQLQTVLRCCHLDSTRVQVSCYFYWCTLKIHVLINWMLLLLTVSASGSLKGFIPHAAPLSAWMFKKEDAVITVSEVLNTRTDFSVIPCFIALFVNLIYIQEDMKIENIKKHAP